MDFPLYQTSTVYGAGMQHPAVSALLPFFYGLYIFFISILMIFSAHLYMLVILRRRCGSGAAEADRPGAGLLSGDPARWPTVTVQIPIYNEGQLAVKSVQLISRLDYPRDKLEILIIDGSTDRTSDLVAAAVAEARQGGDLRIIHHRRDNTKGYKAGGLIEGCEMSRGELIAIFDADFSPRRDFLRRVVGGFDDPRIGCIQTRWGHRNSKASLLTRVQAIILDSFYSNELTARSQCNLVGFFTGTCGVWRKECLVDAGGWETDTLAEDMDISLRAQLRGWRIVYNPNVVTYGELPESLDGFLRQQHRWTLGHTQVCRKLLGRLLVSTLPWYKKAEATFHLLRWVGYPCILGMAVLMMPALVLNPQLQRLKPLESLIGLGLFGLASGAASIFYVTGQYNLYPRSWWRRLQAIPVLFALTLAMAPNNIRAVYLALRGRRHEFLKTPRVGEGVMKARGSERYVPYINLAVGLYLAASFGGTLWMAFSIEAWSFLITALLLGTFAGGLLYAAALGLRNSWHLRRAALLEAKARTPSPTAA